ncbi:MAG: hypothetical protein ACOYL8_03765 [Patescibacteria group bacterium]
MITVGLNQTITQIPKSLYKWIKEKENNFPEIEFQIYFSTYKSENDKDSVIKYELIYQEMPHLRHVFFPRPDGVWDVKIIGDQNKAIHASGIMELLKEECLESFFLLGNTSIYRGYIGLSGNLINEELISI